VAGKPNAKFRARAFAAGIVSGHEQSEFLRFIKTRKREDAECFSLESISNPDERKNVGGSSTVSVSANRKGK
jgi:hypothetical protein